jgi:hypothetical protein
MAQPSSLTCNPLSERAQKVIDNFMPSEELIQKRVEHFSYVKPRQGDKEGDVEVLAGATFTHHFIMGPGDGETVLWHYVKLVRQTLK